MKNLLHVSSRLNANFGGGERFTQILLSGLGDYNNVFIGGHKILLDIFQKQGYEAINYSAGIEPTGLKKTLLSPYSFLRSLWEVIRYNGQFRKADLVICDVSTLAEAVFLFPYITHIFKKPILFINHWGNVPDHVIKSPFFGILKYNLSKCHQVYVSNYQFQKWSDNNLTNYLSSVIHNGVSVSEFKPTIRKADKIFTIGYMSRIDNMKGFDTLINALSMVKTDQDLLIKLGGEGQYISQYQELQNSLDIPKNITIQWLGNIDNTQEFYESLDLFVFPSKFESFGLVGIEAMERGIPVIFNTIDSFKEIMNIQGIDIPQLFFEPNDSNSLAQLITDSINNPELYSIGTKTKLHNFVVNNYSQSKMINEYIEYINKIIN